MPSPFYNFHSTRTGTKFPSNSAQGSKNKPKSHYYLGLSRVKFVSPSDQRVTCGNKSNFISSKALHFSISCPSREKNKGKGTSSYIYAGFLRPGLVCTLTGLPAEESWNWSCGKRWERTSPQPHTAKTEDLQEFTASPDSVLHCWKGEKSAVFGNMSAGQHNGISIKASPDP